jgi:hypothetical protein
MKSPKFYLHQSSLNPYDLDERSIIRELQGASHPKLIYYEFSWMLTDSRLK